MKTTMKKMVNGLHLVLYHLRGLLDPAVEGSPFVADREYEYKTDVKRSFFGRRRWALR